MSGLPIGITAKRLEAIASAQPWRHEFWTARNIAYSRARLAYYALAPATWPRLTASQRRTLVAESEHYRMLIAEAFVMLVKVHGITVTTDKVDEILATIPNLE